MSVKVAADDMHELGTDRRAVLASALGWAAAMGVVRELAQFGATFVGEARADEPAASTPAEPPAKKPFSADEIKEMARKLAASDYSLTSVELPEPFNKLSYDQYRDIRFKPDQAIWRGQKLDTEIQLFPLGWLYDVPVEIWVVENGEARQLTADNHLFTLGPLVGKAAPDNAPFGFSGFRIHGPINRADYLDEYVVFQGASYLRAVGRGENYGASARGLAINTARAGGEEFPYFRGFWIEKPTPGQPGIVVHALLDSPSVAGAYRFIIQPGESTIMDVDVTLFTRKGIPHIGYAPLTSMYLFSPANLRRFNDFRPAVHDSDGLAVLNGGGERLWRPLINHKTLQISAFVDKDPKGFGLAQRKRNFHGYEDLEAHYEHRPTVWVEPKGAWGEGVIELIEIPVDVEIHDNIVVFWKPAKGLEGKTQYDFSYRLNWGEAVPAAWSGAWVDATRVGKAKEADKTLFVIDFTGPAVKDLRDMPVCDLTNSTGQVANVVVQKNPEVSGVRVSFELNPDGAELVELRCALKAGDQWISESWMYRWTKP
ncbi:MAG: glucan biosynthesis protein [Hyphomicrobium sp.]